MDQSMFSRQRVFSFYAEFDLNSLQYSRRTFAVNFTIAHRPHKEISVKMVKCLNLDENPDTLRAILNLLCRYGHQSLNYTAKSQGLIIISYPACDQQPLHKWVLFLAINQGICLSYGCVLLFKLSRQLHLKHHELFFPKSFDESLML